MNRNSVLVLILLLAGFLRFYNLGINPPSLNWDEVAWGYNAYSLGIDGKDEFGRFLPYEYLESFGDFKPPVYAYLDILPIKLFGLTEFAVRFPSAFFGVLTVVITYFLTKRIFPNSQSILEIGNWKLEIPVIAAAILAVSPWHINLSRGAFEANVATFLLITGVWLFLVGIQDKKWYIISAAVSFAVSFYTFNTARIVTPLLVIVLGIGFWKQLLLRKKQVFFACVIGILIVLPIIKFLLSPQASLRFQEVNIFSNINIIKTVNIEIANNNNTWWSSILNNRRIAYTREYFKHYFDNFNPDFLFIYGDENKKFSTRDTGIMYIWELPFFIGGIFYLFKKREGYWWIVPLWLLIGIIPAATARETPHALRIETTLPTFQIIVAYGIISIMQKISNIKYQISNLRYLNSLIIVFIFSLLIFNLIYYLHGYHVHYPREYSGEWQYGYKESIAYIQQVKNQYDQINVTRKMGRPYIYYLFYTKTNPAEFRKTLVIERDVFGFVEVKGFDKYRFSDSLNTIGNVNKKVLYIEIPKDVPSHAKIVKTFHLIDGYQILTAYTL